jgi:hypothetical protein
MRATILLFLVACGDSGPTPSVSVQAATPDRLVTSNDALDDVTITVEYDDGDGDLGAGLAEVHDCRAESIVTELLIPAIAPPERIGDHITGTLDLHVNDVGAIALGTQPPLCLELGVRALDADQTVFCVVLVDAAGNRSSGDCTDTITLFP